MLDICLLGTGGTMPLPNRALTALMCRYGGSSILIDCGEGTQVKIREKGWSLKQIDMIMFTHFHADHTSGLAGLLLSMGKDGRSEKVRIVGPQGVENIVKSLCVVAPELPFELEFTEISDNNREFELKGLRIEAFRVEHSIECFGFTVNIDRGRKFMPQRAEQLGIDKKYWGSLQKGKSVEINGTLILPEDVLGEKRKGIKVTYCTDSRPTESIEMAAENAELFICEGMYAEEDKLEKAIENKHMTFSEAAEIAARSHVKELWLTHYSPSLSEPQKYSEYVQNYFKNTVIPEDLMSKTLKFDN